MPSPGGACWVCGLPAVCGEKLPGRRHKVRHCARRTLTPSSAPRARRGGAWTPKPGATSSKNGCAPPRPLQAFRRDTSAMTAAGSSLDGAVAAELATPQPVQTSSGRSSWRPVSGRGWPGRPQRCGGGVVDKVDRNDLRAGDREPYECDMPPVRGRDDADGSVDQCRQGDLGDSREGERASCHRRRTADRLGAVGAHHDPPHKRPNPIREQDRGAPRGQISRHDDMTARPQQPRPRPGPGLDRRAGPEWVQDCQVDLSICGGPVRRT